MKNHYDILHISENATAKEIKFAFRRLAILYHPDKNKNINAKQKFIEIKNAYDTLSNPIKKASYDKELCLLRAEKLRAKQRSEYKHWETENVSKEENNIKKKKQFIFFAILILLVFLISYITLPRNLIFNKKQYKENIRTIDSTIIQTETIKQNLKNVKPTEPKSGELKF